MKKAEALKQYKYCYKPNNFNKYNCYIKDIQIQETEKNKVFTRRVEFTVRRGKKRYLSAFYLYVPNDLSINEAKEYVENKDFFIRNRFCYLNRINKTVEGAFILSSFGIVDDELSKNLEKDYTVIYEKKEDE